MRIKATDPGAEKIKLVTVDSKRVEMPIELDTDEGWVDCLVPVLGEIKEETPDQVLAGEASEEGAADWQVVRLHGKVEVRQ